MVACRSQHWMEQGRYKALSLESLVAGEEDDSLEVFVVLEGVEPSSMTISSPVCMSLVMVMAGQSTWPHPPEEAW
jgi:hypothetical protein